MIQCLLCALYAVLNKVSYHISKRNDFSPFDCKTNVIVVAMNKQKNKKHETKAMQSSTHDLRCRYFIVDAVYAGAEYVEMQRKTQLVVVVMVDRERIRIALLYSFRNEENRKTSARLTMHKDPHKHPLAVISDYLNHLCSIASRLHTKLEFFSCCSCSYHRLFVRT